MQSRAFAARGGGLAPIKCTEPIEYLDELQTIPKPTPDHDVNPYKPSMTPVAVGDSPFVLMSDFKVDLEGTGLMVEDGARAAAEATEASPVPEAPAASTVVEELPPAITEPAALEPTTVIAQIP